MRKFIVKQTVNYAGRGDKTATFNVHCDDEVELAIFLAELDGQVDVYEQNLSLGAPTAATASSSLVTIDRITMRLKGSESKYISSYNRPIVLKSSTNISVLEESLKTAWHPFEGTFASQTPDDVRIVTGDIRKL